MEKTRRVSTVQYITVLHCIVFSISFFLLFALFGYLLNITLITVLLMINKAHIFVFKYYYHYHHFHFFGPIIHNAIKIMLLVQ